MLTKNDYLLFTQCEKALWLKKNRYAVLSKQEVQEEKEVFLHATKKYPNGTEVVGETREERAEETKRLVKEGVEVLYRAVLAFGDKLVTADVAQKMKNGWKISKITASTSVKERLLDGLAYEWHDLLDEIPGLQVEVLFLNKDYVRGEEMDYDALFQSFDANETIRERTGQIRGAMKEMEKTVNLEECPKKIGPHCSKYGKENVDCPAKAHCWSHVPDYSVFNISRIGKKAWELYQEGVLEVKDIPEDFPLSDTQRFQVEGEKKARVVIEKEKIREFMKSFTFPLYFLDFETYQQPVPKFKGIKPYQQIPFQYSLHILPSLMDNVEHKEFLADENKDDRRALAERLVQDIPRGVTVVVYNMSFEKMVLKDLATCFPDLADHLMNIHDHIVDLMVAFQKKWYYTPDMKGSYSIKYVLPALCPNEESLDYTALAIQNGGMAMAAYVKLAEMNPQEREEVRQALKKYCGLDTFAMVRLWEVLYYI